MVDKSENFMKNHKIKFKSGKNSYSIVIGKNILTRLSNKKKFMPQTKKIALVIDKGTEEFSSSDTKNTKKLWINIFIF